MTEKPKSSAEEIYTPIEGAIDREAERAVCTRLKHTKPIVSVNGQDVECEDEKTAA